MKNISASADYCFYVGSMLSMSALQCAYNVLLVLKKWGI